MTSWLSKIFGGGESSVEKTTTLESIAKTGNNFEMIPADSQNPQHLIANGLIVGSGTPVEIRTAISAVNDVEFSTVMGQVPNTSLGMAITDGLNHQMNGKFLTFDSEQKNQRDVVFATSLAGQLATPQTIHQELENHAKAKVLVSPILSASQSYAQPSPQIDNQSVINIARQIVDVNLDVQNRLISGQANQYIPIPGVSNPDSA